MTEWSDDRRWVIERGSDAYPADIERLSDAPDRLYVRGDPEVLGRPALAIIGSRVATPYGIACSQLAARVAAEAGIVVVSGGALGCDQAGGREVLDAAGRMSPCSAAARTSCTLAAAQTCSSAHWSRAAPSYRSIPGARTPDGGHFRAETVS